MSEWERPPANRWIRGVIAVAVAGVVAGAGVLSLRSTGSTGELEISQELVPPTVETITIPWPAPRRGSWRTLPPAPLTSRVNYTVVWTGSEMIVWGGFDALNRPQLDGAAFDPKVGTWRTLPFTAARDAAAIGVAAGTQVLFVSAEDTRRYDPAKRRWRDAPTLPVPERHTVGDRIVSAGWAVVALTEPYDRTQPSGAFVLRPGAAQWQRLPDVPVTMTRGHTVLTSGNEVMVVGPPVGGQPPAVTIDLDTVPPTWRRISAPPDPDAVSSTWRTMPPPPNLEQQNLATLSGATFGDDIMLFGVRSDRPRGYAALREDGAWRVVDPGPLEPSRFVSVLWTGDQVLVWDRLNNTGAALDPSTERWTRVPPPPLVGLDLARDAEWAGTGLLVWGALGTGGAMYTPP